MILRVPNELKEEDVTKYQMIFKEVHGIDITLEEARFLGMSLIRLMAVIIRNSGKNL